MVSTHTITQVALLSNNWKMLMATTEPPAVNRNVSLAIQQLKKRGKLSMHSGVKSNRTSSKATSLSNVHAMAAGLELNSLEGPFQPKPF